MNEARRGRGRNRQRQKSPIDIRALLTNREYIKTTAYLLPRAAKVRVLEMMERLRADRRAPKAPSPDDGAHALPEMTGAELVREINWRIGTLPPRDADTVARYIRHLTRWRAARRRRENQNGAAPGASPGRRAMR